MAKKDRKFASLEAITMAACDDPRLGKILQSTKTLLAEEVLAEELEKAGIDHTPFQLKDVRVGIYVESEYRRILLGRDQAKEDPYDQSYDVRTSDINLKRIKP